MKNHYEIERKFLICLPELDKLNITSRTAITQTYLKNTESDAQRRVRRSESGGVCSYTYTEKVFVTAVTRKEFEISIDEAEYLRLLTQAREDCAPVEKVRYCFEYRSQMFEMDVYPFSDKLAILELELENDQQEIYFPDTIKIIKEVSDDGRYSNAALASAASFPEISA